MSVLWRYPPGVGGGVLCGVFFRSRGFTFG